MAEITWKNVNSLTDVNPYLSAIRNMQGSLSALADVGSNYIERRHQDDIRANEKLTQMNTDMVVNQMNQVQDFAQLQKAKQSGAYDLSGLQALTGGAIDGKQFNQAYSNWDKNVLDKAQTTDTALDYNPETKQAMAQYYQAIAQGDTAKAAQIFQGINASRGTMYSLAKDQYGILKDERQYNRDILKDNLDMEQRLTKAKSEREKAAESITAYEKAANSGYLIALQENPNLTFQEYLAKDPEYQKLKIAHTEANTIYDTINSEFTKYSMGRALGTTNGSSFQSQLERATENAADSKSNGKFQLATGLDKKLNRPTRNNNPFNLEPDKFASGVGANKTDGRFAVFDSVEQSFKAMDNKMTKGWMKDHSINSFTMKYLGVDGGKDGHTKEDAQKYSQLVTEYSGVDPNKKISEMTPKERYETQVAIAKVEGFKGTIPKYEDINKSGVGTEVITAVKNVKDALVKAGFVKPSNTKIADTTIANVTKAAKKKKEELPNFQLADGTLDLDSLVKYSKTQGTKLDNDEFNAREPVNANGFKNISVANNNTYNQVFDELLKGTSPEKWSNATKTFVAQYPQANPDHPDSNKFLSALSKKLAEYSDNVDAYKTEAENTVIQSHVGGDKIGALTRDTFNVPKQITLNTKVGQRSYTARELKNQFFDASGKRLKDQANVDKAIDAIFAQTGLYDRYTARDNIRHAIQATGNPMLVLKAYQQMVLETYRHKEGNPKATLQDIPKGYAPDMDYNSFDGKDFGKQFLETVDALAGFNESSLKTLQNQFNNIDNNHDARKSGAAKAAYIRDTLARAVPDEQGNYEIGDAREWMDKSGLTRRTFRNESEQQRYNEGSAKAREVLKSLPETAQSFINKIDKYGTLDESEKAYITQDHTSKSVELSAKQYKDIMTLVQNHSNNEDVKKLVKFLQEYGTQIKIKK